MNIADEKRAERYGTQLVQTATERWITEGDLAERTRYKVTVLPKLQYWRVVSSECCGAGGAAYTSDAVDRHLCSLRVPCERERRTRAQAAAPAAPAGAPPPPAAPAPPPPPPGPFIYNTHTPSAPSPASRHRPAWRARPTGAWAAGAPPPPNVTNVNSEDPLC
ncbi:hypothetical protein PYW08_003486 [Mythimna loreyi]|uniref:Uncharacterized protein n=1 Tax=Mythimna loreyi TaxID=667449 RepID=A0ACC2QRB6_9NEOP|nr:hypothetical protein PYW08_003486 [Mythimna loreyi]